MKTCVNCGHESVFRHCPECGQKLDVKRVTFRGIIEEFFSKWIGFDNQFGRTVIDMTVRPGQVINSYLKGNRTKYLGPLGYVVIMTALLIISFDLFGLEVSDFLKVNSETFNPNQEMTVQQAELQQKLMEFMARNFRFLAALMIPFLAISLGWFYRVEKLNYIERVVVSTYMSCQAMWITMIMLGVLAFTGHLLNVTGIILTILFYSYILQKTFPRKNYLIALLKSLGVYVGAVLVLILLMIIVGFVVGLIFAILNPEMIQPQG
ncbi:DUF3667 domain-containing protein [Ekhidna sp.]|uniref:DUF3667 domain-containing protein n=1 Tax=Ekhidna sp. TaxID=2608089 RepID=UPI0035124AE9